RGGRVLRLRGVLNSTSSHVSWRLSEGDSLEAAIRDAQRLGIAEADPSYDLDGWDAAVKATVLANALLGADLRPQQVLRDGVGAAALEAAVRASPGRRVKQLVEIDPLEGSPEGARASVRLTALEPASALGALRGMGLALTITTDVMADLTWVE